jgi:hypothetical protein
VRVTPWALLPLVALGCNGTTSAPADSAGVDGALCFTDDQGGRVFRIGYRRP